MFFKSRSTERSLLKPEEMRESADSRTRMKVVKKGMASIDVSPKMKKNEEKPDRIRALEKHRTGNYTADISHTRCDPRF